MRICFGRQYNHGTLYTKTYHFYNRLDEEPASYFAEERFIIYDAFDKVLLREISIEVVS